MKDGESSFRSVKQDKTGEHEILPHQIRMICGGRGEKKQKAELWVDSIKWLLSDF